MAWLWWHLHRPPPPGCRLWWVDNEELVITTTQVNTHTEAGTASRACIILQSTTQHFDGIIEHAVDTTRVYLDTSIDCAAGTLKIDLCRRCKPSKWAVS